MNKDVLQADGQPLGRPMTLRSGYIVYLVLINFLVIGRLISVKAGVYWYEDPLNIAVKVGLIDTSV